MDKVSMLQNGKWKADVWKPKSYIVKMENGRSYRRNQTHLIKTIEGSYDNTIIGLDDTGNVDFDLSNTIKEETNLQENTGMSSSGDKTDETAAYKSGNVV